MGGDVEHRGSGVTGVKNKHKSWCLKSCYRPTPVSDILVSYRWDISVRWSTRERQAGTYLAGSPRVATSFREFPESFQWVVVSCQWVAVGRFTHELSNREKHIIVDTCVIYTYIYLSKRHRWKAYAKASTLIFSMGCECDWWSYKGWNWFSIPRGTIMCASYLSLTAYYAVYFYAGDANWFTFTKTNRGIIVNIRGTT